MKDSRTFRNKKNVEKALRLLRDVTEVLEEYGIEYYLDFGTLIGAVRSGSFIPWDHDIDISLKNREDYPKMPEVLEEIARRYHYRTYLYTFAEMAERRRKRGRESMKMVPPFAKESDYQIAKIRTNKFFRFGKGHICLDIFFKYTYEDHSYWYAYGRVTGPPSKPWERSWCLSSSTATAS